jgi:hypothetical protein
MEYDVAAAHGIGELGGIENVGAVKRAPVMKRSWPLEKLS